MIWTSTGRAGRIFKMSNKIVGTMPPRKRNAKPGQLYLWRLKNGLTQKEASEKFGVSFSTYRRLELMPTLPKKYALAFASVKTKFPA